MGQPNKKIEVKKQLKTKSNQPSHEGFAQVTHPDRMSYSPMPIEELERMTYQESRETYGHPFTEEELTQFISNAKQADCHVIKLEGLPSPYRWKEMVKETHSRVYEDGKWFELKGWDNVDRIVKGWSRAIITCECMIAHNIAHEEGLIENFNEQDYMATMNGMMYIQNIVIPYLKIQRKMYETIKTPKPIEYLEKIDMLTNAMGMNYEFLRVETLTKAWQHSRTKDQPTLFLLADTPMDERGKKAMESLQWMVENYTMMLGKY